MVKDSREFQQRFSLKWSQGFWRYRSLQFWWTYWRSGRHWLILNLDVGHSCYGVLEFPSWAWWTRRWWLFHWVNLLFFWHFWWTQPDLHLNDKKFTFTELHENNEIFLKGKTFMILHNKRILIHITELFQDVDLCYGNGLLLLGWIIFPFQWVRLIASFSPRKACC